MNIIKIILINEIKKLLIKLTKIAKYIKRKNAAKKLNVNVIIKC